MRNANSAELQLPQTVLIGDEQAVCIERRKREIRKLQLLVKRPALVKRQFSRHAKLSRNAYFLPKSHFHAKRQLHGTTTPTGGPRG